jgi:probable addiction module antidote protein
MISAYLTETHKTNDSKAVAKALAPVARARGGMDRLSSETGISRQELQSALGGTDRPDFDTILKVIQAFGRTLLATKDKHHSAAV